MPACANLVDPLSMRKPSAVAFRLRPSVLIWLIMIGLGALAAASEFTIKNVQTSLYEGVYRLDADILYQLSPEVEEALTNSVPLTIAIEMNVHRERALLWDENVHSLQQRFRLTYHALAQQYVVNNLNSNQLHSFPTRDAAMQFIGRIRDFPLLDRSLLDPAYDYQISLRAELDIESLPAPLRLVAYLSKDWRLTSDWYTVAL